MCKGLICVLTVQSLDTIEHLRQLLGQMLPPGVGFAAEVITEGEEWVEYPEEELQVANAVSKRRFEFISGRRCARKALARIGVKPCALVADENRVPKWPTGVVASISHSMKLCCAVAAHSDAIVCLGVDLETTTRISPGVIERVTHPLEKAYVNDGPARGSLIFSAKEAFFKAQFPVWKSWPNFNDLAFWVETSGNRLKVQTIASHLPEDLRIAANNMQFRYAFFDNCVLTLCWLTIRKNLSG